MTSGSDYDIFLLLGVELSAAAAGTGSAAVTALGALMSASVTRVSSVLFITISGELQMDISFCEKNKNICLLCPRKCGVDRTNIKGYCGADSSIRVARASLHMWEEPPISGKNGSGTIFFSGCSLKCCFCQNYRISAENFGKDISPSDLQHIMLRLQADGAHNINLVTPTHYADKIADVLRDTRSRLTIPVIYNTSGYECNETLNMMSGLVDIYMPDLKYFSPALSEKYSHAKNYFLFASEAVKKMHRQVGNPVFDKNGLLKSGLMIRHMILPGAYKDSLALLDWLRDTFSNDSIILNLMCQYTPYYKSSEYKEIDRRLTTYEYEKVTDYAAKLGFKGFCQQKSSASQQYIPDFDLSGI